MVHTPYGADEAETDARKLKLQLQAQGQFISQLQQRVAKQSMTIEELQSQIQQLKQVIAEKDAELGQYSKRLEEERKYWEEDKKARTNRERELIKTIKEKEMEIRRLQEIIDNFQRKSTNQSTMRIDQNVNKLLCILLAYSNKPTDTQFIDALRDLMSYIREHGTLEQKILGLLSKSDLPMSVDEISSHLRLDRNKVNIALQGLLREKLVKNIGKGYTVISSELISQSPREVDWSASSAKEILDQLSSMVFIAESNEELVLAFTKARDRLMELGALSPLTRHAMSQQINRIKSGNYDPAELQKLLKSWRDQLQS